MKTSQFLSVNGKTVERNGVSFRFLAKRPGVSCFSVKFYRLPTKKRRALISISVQSFIHFTILVHVGWFFFCLTSLSTIVSHVWTEPPFPGYLPVLRGA